MVTLGRSTKPGHLLATPEYLAACGVQLRDVERAGVGETPVLHMRRKNLADVRLKVYAVDFMILYALRRDLSDVNKIDVAGVEPMTSNVAQPMRLRDDVVSDGDKVADVLGNAPRSADGFFVVPKVVE